MRQINTGSGKTYISGSCIIGNNITNVTIVNGKVLGAAGDDTDIVRGNNKLATSVVALPAFESLANYGVPAEIVSAKARWSQHALQPTKTFYL